jgi:hypothetical protein
VQELVPINVQKANPVPTAYRPYAHRKNSAKKQPGSKQETGGKFYKYSYLQHAK